MQQGPKARPEKRGELGKREALAAKRLPAPRSGNGRASPQCVFVGVGGGPPGRHGCRLWSISALYWREARCEERESDSRVAQGCPAGVKAQPLGSDVRAARNGKATIPKDAARTGNFTQS